MLAPDRQSDHRVPRAIASGDLPADVVGRGAHEFVTLRVVRGDRSGLFTRERQKHHPACVVHEQRGPIDLLRFTLLPSAGKPNEIISQVIVGSDAASPIVPSGQTDGGMSLGVVGLHDSGGKLVLADHGNGFAVVADDVQLIHREPSESGVVHGRRAHGHHRDQNRRQPHRGKPPAAIRILQLRQSLFDRLQFRFLCGQAARWSGMRAEKRT